MSVGSKVKNVLFRALALAFDRRATLPTVSPSRILVLQLQQVGDTIVFSPTMRTLRRAFPSVEIDVLANGTSAQLYHRSPWVNRVIVADEWKPGPGGQRLAAMRRTIQAMRLRRYDWVITDVTQQAFKYSLIAFLSGARARVGFNIGHRGFLHTIQVDFRSTMPYVQCNLDIARAVGIDASDMREEIAFTDADLSDARALLRELGVDGGDGFAVLHPGSNWQSKTWWPDRWAAVADAISSRGVRVVFVGTPSEAPVVDEVRRAMRFNSATAVGRTNLLQLAALLSQARLFAGTDSGPRNIARAVGIAHVVVMSAQEDTNRWIGTRSGEVVLRASARCTGCYFSTCNHRLCMDAVSTSDVIHWCDQILGTAGGGVPVPVLEQVEVAPELYRRHAGDQAATCARLRALAKEP